MKGLLSFLLNKNFLIIILLALLLRISPTLYLLGGQDQGTYVSMASQYIREKKHYVFDEYRESLTNQQKELYDRNGDYIMPSFENWNRPDNEYSMVFYPVYPALLGLFGSIFGMDKSVYMLTLFSLITLINIYLIVYKLLKNKKIATITTILFVLNPVHVFMSKYPVGEIAAMTFITSGYMFLITYLQSTKENKNKFYLLLLSLMSFGLFSLTRMTYFIHIPVILFLAVYNKKPFLERLTLVIYGVLNIGVLITSYIVYRILFYPLYVNVYPKTIEKMLSVYLPWNIPNIYKIGFIIILITTLLIVSFWKKLHKKIQKYFPIVWSIFSMILLTIIFIFAVRNYNYLTSPNAVYFSRYNITPDIGLNIIKHVPLFSLANYISVFGILILIFLVLYNLFHKTKPLNIMLTGITLYFTFVYLSNTKVMRYDYYNSRYYLTEVIPSILLTVGIFLGDLLNGKTWQKWVARISLLLILSYFSFFSFFQIGKYEGNDRKFYKNISNVVTEKDLIVYINKDIYNNKYSSNFNSYVAGPLKYYFNYNVLVLDSFEELQDPVAQSFLDKHSTVYYLSNVPNESDEDGEKLTLHYNYFNNPPGCNYHNYEFLETVNVKEWPLPKFLECKLLPNAYFENIRNYYFGYLKQS